MRLSRILPLAMAALAAAGCTKSEDRYNSTYPCSFVFRADYHPTSLLKRVLDNPGMFVSVSARHVQGVPHLDVVPNAGGEKETIALTTEIERRYDYSHIGAGNGILIGTTTLSEQKAYDAQCPACLDRHMMAKYPLKWTDNGQAVACAACKRKYVLSYGASDDGIRLLEYRMRFNGSILTVGN